DDIFNISFVSEEIQTLSIRVLNIVGEVVYIESLEQFVGEYTKKVSIGNKSRGVYFLEISDNNGIINKKIILQ
ncbi:MAG: T9SS type A sorting domain-containing protein, partial [Flavobacteriales bacterium]|nr:T9SS type A sorting domain-containing protein [Flavobacteriales bacterium]